MSQKPSTAVTVPEYLCVTINPFTAMMSLENDQ